MGVGAGCDEVAGDEAGSAQRGGSVANLFLRREAEERCHARIDEQVDGGFVVVVVVAIGLRLQRAMVAQTGVEILD